MLVQALEELRQTLSKKEQQVRLTRLNLGLRTTEMISDHFIYTYFVGGL